jgi:hypothetical protein
MTNDSEKVLPSQKYQREDLIWEAVRRNELYKADYRRLLKKESNKKKEISKWERLPRGLRYSLCWEMDGLLDPEITIDEIKEVIASEERLRSVVHPYYYLYKKKPPVIQFKVKTSIYVPEEIIYGHEFSILKSDPSAFVIPKRFLIDKIIIAIDPEAGDSRIIGEIKKIKQKALTQLEEELQKAIESKSPREINYDNDDDKSQITKRTYYARELDSYIGWLKKYDQIITEYIRKNTAKGLILNDQGALELPKKCYFPDFVLTDKDKKYATIVKAWERAYDEAIILIQSATDIKVAPPRVQKSRKALLKGGEPV